MDTKAIKYVLFVLSNSAGLSRSAALSLCSPIIEFQPKRWMQ